jgi:hypothetical protein
VFQNTHTRYCLKVCKLQVAEMGSRYAQVEPMIKHIQDVYFLDAPSCRHPSRSVLQGCGSLKAHHVDEPSVSDMITHDRATPLIAPHMLLPYHTSHNTS